MNPPCGPALSVIVASAAGEEALHRCLRALLPQARSSDVEVVVVDASGRDLPPPVVETHGATWLSFPPKTILPVLWGAGLDRARAPVIAVTDTTTVVDAGWVEAVLAAHRPEHLVVGGAVETLPCRSLTDWAAFFCEYAQFMRPLEAGPAAELPGNNIAFKRGALAHGRRFTAPEFWKSYWCKELRRAGLSLRADPSMVVYNAKSYRLVPFLRRRFLHGRCFGGMRTAGMGVIRRSAYVLGALLLPPLFLARLFRMIFRKKRHLGPFARTLPHSVLAILAWSAGEFLGYLTGPGTSCRHVH